MIGVINSPSKKGILNEAKNYSDTKLTEAKKYTNDEVAKLPSSCIRHTQSGYINVNNSSNTNDGTGTDIALSGFTDKDKMIVIFTPTLSVPRNASKLCLYTGGLVDAGSNANVVSQPFYPYINIISNALVRFYMANSVCIDGSYNAIISFRSIRIEGTYKVIEFY